MFNPNRSLEMIFLMGGCAMVFNLATHSGIFQAQETKAEDKTSLLLLIFWNLSLAASVL